MKDFLVILVSVMIGSAGQVLFRVGMRSFGSVSLTNIWASLVRIMMIPAIPIGFLCFGLSSILWLVVVSKMEVSYAYPMVSMGYIFVLAASWLFLGEHLSLLRVLAVLLICFGVALISRS